MERKSPVPGVHSGHRKRVKANVCNNGFSQLEDHRLLELLLFYAIPQADTNELAHTLLNEFGSFDEIVKADISRLKKVKGVGENTAIMLAAMGEMYCRMGKVKHVKKRVYTSPEDYKTLTASVLAGESKECVYIFCFDSKGTLKGKTLLSSGDSASSFVDVRKAVQAVIDCDAKKAVLAHNHPEGEADPSANDIDTTRCVAVMFRRLGVMLVDHIIVDESLNTFSMYSEPSLQGMFY